MVEERPSNDFDSPWKEILEAYLPEFLAFFFPDAHRAIDWDAGFGFLDNELRQVIKDAQLGKRFVDKLVQVYRRGGEETWVLLHIEIQSQYEADFAKRMFTYHYRIFDRFDRQVGSLVVLGDESETWLPGEFGYELFGSSIAFRFPVTKLLDRGRDWTALEKSHNPFAVVVMAHLKAQQTKRDESERLRWKLTLTKSLYGKGYSRQDIINLFRFIDWIMGLSAGLESQFLQEVYQFEEERKMPYITSAERFGFQRGKEEGRQEGKQEGKQEGEANLVLRQLYRRVGFLDTELESMIRHLSIEDLEELGEALLDFREEIELREWLEERNPDRPIQ